MEILKNKSYIRKQQEFPHFEKKTGLKGILFFIVSVFIWGLLLFVSLVALYTHWFTRSLIYILNLFQRQSYYVPFWFSLICVIFLFPVTLIVILVASLVKIIKA